MKNKNTRNALLIMAMRVFLFLGIKCEITKTIALKKRLVIATHIKKGGENNERYQDNEQYERHGTAGDFDGKAFYKS